MIGEEVLLSKMTDSEVVRLHLWLVRLRNGATKDSAYILYALRAYLTWTEIERRAGERNRLGPLSLRSNAHPCSIKAPSRLGWKPSGTSRRVLSG